MRMRSKSDKQKLAESIVHILNHTDTQPNIAIQY